MTHDYFFSEEHNAFRETMRKFVSKEIEPKIEEWEEAGCYDRSIFNRMGELGFLGLSYPLEYGGADADNRMSVVFWEELVRCGALGFPMSVMVQTDMATPSLNHAGNHEQKEKYLKGACSGELLIAIGMTEPNYGSDLANIETRATLEGDYYRVNGTKMFITNGTTANVINTLVRTGGPGYKGCSLLLIDADTPGFSVGKKLRKMGNLSSDTAELVFEDCLVPRGNLLGKEGEGFYALMAGLEKERQTTCALSYMAAQVALDESIKYAQERMQFKKPIISHQVIGHMIAEMAMDVEAMKRIFYHAAALYDAKIPCNKEVSMAKLFCTETALKVIDKAVQIHGGYGYMREYKVERLYRDIKLMTIGAGTSQIMKHVILREMGLRV
ncbi:MAG: acyl-CoA dehydrogenase family protein [Dehalococcoidales bacterium]|jgi:alkylation response protein AidB-like acyl-CoA dehydrogenase|nr:acyl-CoA dehydrogenase family protein [Syntrophales bacterium]MDX9803398.1 acyl-CoA dehydrogenase family protein [Dehalococcoidales bacterium]